MALSAIYAQPLNQGPTNYLVLGQNAADDSALRNLLSVAGFNPKDNSAGALKTSISQLQRSVFPNNPAEWDDKAGPKTLQGLQNLVARTPSLDPEVQKFLALRPSTPKLNAPAPLGAIKPNTCTADGMAALLGGALKSGTPAEPTAPKPLSTAVGPVKPDGSRTLLTADAGSQRLLDQAGFKLDEARGGYLRASDQKKVVFGGQKVDLSAKNGEVWANFTNTNGTTGTTKLDLAPGSAGADQARAQTAIRLTEQLKQAGRMPDAKAAEITDLLGKFRTQGPAMSSNDQARLASLLLTSTGGTQ